MLAKINSLRGAAFLAALLVLLAGCTPAGPRALLKGKKYLDRGNVTEAVVQFRRAATLLETNAAAWNYYGVALQRAGQPDDAVAAYQNALKFDRDLAETHFNLGMLWLEQNRPDLATGEFTAYTLRRPNDADGWLKLGFAQLRTGATLASERSFSSVLALKPNDPPAYNGLGLAYIQLGKPRDGAKFFTAALQSRPDFAPALLNLATVNQQYLHDTKAALENYQAYLALNPHPADYNEVKALVANLAQSDVATTIMAPAVIRAPPAEPKPHPANSANSHQTSAAHAESDETSAAHAPAHTTVSSSSTVASPPSASVTPVPTQTVQVPAKTPILATPQTNPPPVAVAAAVTEPKPATNAVAAAEPIEVPMPEEAPRPGFWHRVFNSSKSASSKRYHNQTVPIPADTEEMAGTKPDVEKPSEPKPAPAKSVPRYSFTSPAKPAPGDRRAAEGAFTKARLAEQDQNWPDAEHWYQTAAEDDPSWFEAQFNTGVIAHRLRNFTVALPRYEFALAIQPDSVDARYNFALALRSAGYPLDAADQLSTILAAAPNEVRAHLALANLCAQALHDIPQARQHYLKVLDLQPNNPQAADIRFWLSANSK
jgi:tetratricopeptide (TPR) repeat protein